MVAEMDFMRDGAKERPKEAGWRDIPPMWKVPNQAYRGINENITFGMGTIGRPLLHSKRPPLSKVLPS